MRPLKTTKAARLFYLIQRTEGRRSTRSQQLKRGVLILQPRPTAFLTRQNARSGRRLPPYRPHPPRALAPGPQSGKRHSDRGVSIFRNAPRRHPARAPSVPRCWRCRPSCRDTGYPASGSRRRRRLGRGVSLVGQQRSTSASRDLLGHIWVGTMAGRSIADQSGGCGLLSRETFLFPLALWRAAASSRHFRFHLR
jgi:hypothetical protein